MKTLLAYGIGAKIYDGEIEMTLGEDGFFFAGVVVVGLRQGLSV